MIPIPAEAILDGGSFRMHPGLRLRVAAGDPDAAVAARYLSGLLARSRGLSLAVQTGGPSAGTIAFERRSGLGPEAYRLEVLPRGITISATGFAGLLYGAVTLWELLPPGRGEAYVPAQRIRDQPAYPWRGLMLDSARHFQSPAFVKSMIDWMAWHKLNVLHWHLTDDQGWRLEIRKYPRLTAIGAWRTPASVGAPSATRYGGFYTQREVQDIVAFAATRNVTIVPEIDMPGHAQAAIAAYPALGSTDGAAPPVSARWGVHTYLFNPDEATLSFLEDVLAEVVELFPGPYVHVGGDEAVKDQWRASPRVLARARQLGIDDMEALQGYFTDRMGRFLAARGRRLVGWDEILRPDLNKNAVVMSWRGTSGARAAAIAGYDTVLSPWPTLYFDNRQSTLPSEPPGRTSVISLEAVYRFEMRDAALDAAQQRHVLGVQANVWTEHIRTEERVEWMTLPRAAAVAELGWSPPSRRSWPDFLARLAASLPRYHAFGIHVADSVFAVDGRLKATAAGAEVSLTNQAHVGDIRYTTDGHEPSNGSAVYSAPLALAPGGEVRAATFVGGAQVSATWSRHIDRAALARRSSRELDLCSDGLGLLLEPRDAGGDPAGIVALDIMNPCWIYRAVDLSHGGRLTAAVAALPFNFEIGADVNKIRVGDARTANGELEVRLDACDAAPAATVALGAARGPATLPAVALPQLPGRHDVCLRFARPALEPMWALDWVEIGE